MHTLAEDLRGRDAELALLRERLAAALGGRGAVVVVSGEDGSRH
ncbi:MAG TPA: hypothetical protein VF331_27565 [Polyangiales bacterium]